MNRFNKTYVKCLRNLNEKSSLMIGGEPLYDGDYLYNYDGYLYVPEEAKEEDVKKIYHFYVDRNGEVDDIDFDPYRLMSEEDFQNYIDAGLPSRKDLGLRGPINSDDLS